MSVLDEYLVLEYENMAECGVYSLAEMSLFLLCVCVCAREVVWVSVRARLKRCCLRLVCFWCRWVGVTLKTFPASLTLSLSSPQTCHYTLHLRVSGVLEKKKTLKQAEAFLQPSRYLEEGCERARHVRAKKKDIRVWHISVWSSPR